MTWESSVKFGHRLRRILAPNFYVPQLKDFIQSQPTSDYIRLASKTDSQIIEAAVTYFDTPDWTQERFFRQVYFDLEFLNNPATRDNR